MGNSTTDRGVNLDKWLKVCELSDHSVGESGKAAAPGDLQEERRKQGVLSVYVCLRMANDVDRRQMCLSGPQGVS